LKETGQIHRKNLLN